MERLALLVCLASHGSILTEGRLYLGYADGPGKPYTVYDNRNNPRVADVSERLAWDSWSFLPVGQYEDRAERLAKEYPNATARIDYDRNLPHSPVGKDAIYLLRHRGQDSFYAYGLHMGRPDFAGVGSPRVAIFRDRAVALQTLANLRRLGCDVELSAWRAADFAKWVIDERIAAKREGIARLAKPIPERVGGFSVYGESGVRWYDSVTVYNDFSHAIPALEAEIAALEERKARILA